MHEPDNSVEDRHEGMTSALLVGGVAVVVQRTLAQLEIPVTEFMPDEGVELGCSIVEAILVQSLSDLPNRLVGPSQDPPVLLFELTGSIWIIGVQMHLEETKCLPDLVLKLHIPFGSLVVPENIAALRGKRHHGHAKGVRSEFLDLVEGVYNVPFRL